jgi:hypothetical protein
VPCRASIPHLNETYNKFKDKGLIVIGQDCSEPDESKVAAFVKSMGDTMTYRVALDDKQGSKKGTMEETWMQAAGRHSIPTAFLIDTTGHVAWIGHPMTLKEKSIEAVLAGTYNAKEEAAAEEKENAQMRSFGLKLDAAMQAKDWDAALSNLDEMTKVAPEAAVVSLSMLRIKILASKKDYPAAFKLIREVGDAHKDDPMMQNDLAWMMISDKSIEHPDLGLALKLAQRATDGARLPAEKGMFMDTLARVKFMQGSKEEGIALEQKAMALAGDSEKDKFQKTLDSYKKGELPEAE